MHKLLIVAFAATSLLAAPVAAAKSEQASAPKAQAAAGTNASANSGENKVCKWVDRPGTHAKQRFCLSNQAWQKLQNNQD